MAMGPIPHTSIMDYADRLGMSGDESEFFATVLHTIDAEFLRMMSARHDGSGRMIDVEEVSINDVEGSKQVMNRLLARANAAKKKSN
jgi:hypothetical protein